MKHLFITVLLILALATPASATGSGWGWDEPEVIEEEIVEEVIVEEDVEEAVVPDSGLMKPNTAQYLFDKGYSSISPSGWGEPTEIVAVAEVVVELTKVEPVVITETVIVYETVYVVAEVDEPAAWWHTMEAEEPSEVAKVKGISTPDTGGGGIFWLGLAAVILGVAIVVRLEGRGE